MHPIISKQTHPVNNQQIQPVISITHEFIMEANYFLCQILTICAQPIHFKCIKTNKEFQIQQHYHQAIELICQPEVSKSNMVEGSCQDSKLEYKKYLQNRDLELVYTAYSQFRIRKLGTKNVGFELQVEYADIYKSVFGTRIYRKFTDRDWELKYMYTKHLHYNMLGNQNLFRTKFIQQPIQSKPKNMKLQNT